MDRRMILFIVMTLAIWWGYFQFLAPTPLPSQPGNQTTQPGQTPDLSDVKPVSGEAIAPANIPPPVIKVSLHPDVPLATKVIGTEHFSAVFSNRGGSLESVTLAGFCAPKSKDSLKIVCPIEVIVPPQSQNNLMLKLIEPADDMANVNWEMIDSSDVPLSPAGRDGLAKSVTFRYTSAQGLVIYKKFYIGGQPVGSPGAPQSLSPRPSGSRFRGANRGNYTIDYRIELENSAGQPISTTLQIGGINGMIPEQDDRMDLSGIRAYRDKQKDKWYVSEEVKLPQLQKEKSYNLITNLDKAKGAGKPAADSVDWTGLANRYFASVIIPVTPTDISEYNFSLLSDNNISFGLVTNRLLINAGEKKSLDFIFYCGPKTSAELEPLVQYGGDKLLDYGIFGFISRIILSILGFIHGIFNNYGVAIILLTIMIKVMLFPLTKKSQVSMYHMQKLSPRLKELQAQYKNDKQRMAAEQMKMWKEYGVNPLSGCLPVFFQIPVFFGLYWALALSIELRQAPFVSWISDLSQPDQLMRLPTTILGATHLHLLPLLMTASWLVQSLTQPKSPDPQARQTQKMMTFMPLIFLFFFYNVPSGLTLYWFTSTLLGIAEQQIIKKFYIK